MSDKIKVMIFTVFWYALVIAIALLWAFCFKLY